MIRLPNRVFNVDPQRARDELAAAWEHLAAAAEHGANQLEQASRRRAALARSRATALRRVVRGEPPTSRWRWLGAGLAAGVVIGAAGGAVATRRRAADPSGSGNGTLGQVRERGGAAVAGAREQARTAVHTAASAARSATDTARDTVAKARDKIGGDTDPAAPEPPGRTP